MKKLPLLMVILFLTGCQSLDQEENSPAPPQGEIKKVVPLTESPDLPGVIFTDISKIKEAEKSTVIMDELIKFVHATPENESIYISIYLFEYAPLITALKEAYSRGVDIHISLDRSDRSNNQATITDLASLGENIEIIPVNNNASSIAINHNKFVLFSSVETAEGALNEVVFQTSHNFTNSGTKKIQDALLFSHSALYNAYLNYWEQIKNHASDSMDQFTFTEYKNESGNIHVQFYPKRKDGEPIGEDSILEILDKVTNPGQSTITVGMSDWSDSRVSVLNKLEELLEKGSKIEIITKTGKGPQVTDMLKKLEAKGALIKVFNMNRDAQIPVINIHTKILLIDGEYENKDQKVLITGTQNFTNNALWNNNEVTLILKDENIFNDYQEYFQQLKKLPGIDLTQ